MLRLPRLTLNLILMRHHCGATWGKKTVSFNVCSQFDAIIRYMCAICSKCSIRYVEGRLNTRTMTVSIVPDIYIFPEMVWEILPIWVFHWNGFGDTPPNNRIDEKRYDIGLIDSMCNWLYECKYISISLDLYSLMYIYTHCVEPVEWTKVM